MKRREVGQLLTQPIVVAPSTPISKIVGALKQTNGYEVFLEGENKISMVTLRDVLRASNVTAAKAETLAFFVPRLEAGSTVHEAARLMVEYHIRALPIMDGKAIRGTITAPSIITAMQDTGVLKYTAANIMTGHPTPLKADDLAAKARQLMIRRRIDHLPVLSTQGLEGVVTSSHLIFNMFRATETMERSTIIAEEQRKLEFPVNRIMDRHPVTCRPNDGIAPAFVEMKRLGVSYTLVTLWEEVQGIITYRDYMKLLVADVDRDRVPIYIVGLPEDPFEAEMARSKFQKTVEFLSKGLPYIEEAKSTIRIFPAGEKGRRRFEVKASLVTPKKVYTYTETGWELSSVYDAISNKMKKMLQQRRRARPQRR